MIQLLEPSVAQLNAILEVLETEGGVTSDGFATGPIPDALNDPADPDQIILSLGGVASDGTVIPSSLQIENLDKLAPFQAALREVGIDDSETFNTLVRTFDQNRNENLQDFDANEGNIAEISELFQGANFLDEAGAAVVDNDNNDDNQVVADDGVNNDDLVLQGSDRGEVLQGGAGDDDLNALGGRDEVNGEDGNDLLNGGGGEDVVRGGAGDDTVIGGGGSDQLFGDAGNDTLSGDGSEDVVRGGAGDDTLFGGGGQDELFGDVGNDSLRGDNGDDQLNGGAGDDILDGGTNNDTLTGGDGADTFVFAANGGNDRITDFAAGVDKLELVGFGENAGVEAEQRGDDTVLKIDNQVRIRLEDFDANEFDQGDVSFVDEVDVIA